MSIFTTNCIVLGLLFAKSIVGWGDIITWAALATKSCKNCMGCGCLFGWGEND